MGSQDIIISRFGFDFGQVKSKLEGNKVDLGFDTTPTEFIEALNQIIAGFSHYLVSHKISNHGYLDFILRKSSENFIIIKNNKNGIKTVEIHSKTDRYISDEIPYSLIFYLSKALPLFTSWPISVYKPKAIRFIDEKGDELVPDITFFVFYILNIYYKDYIVLDVEKLLEYLKKIHIVI